MSKLRKLLNDKISDYIDRRFQGSEEEYKEALKNSTTVYVGNIAFSTTDEQIYEVFSRVGDIKDIHMGLDKHNKSPCGFCFVEYYTRKAAEDCVKFINGTMVDERPIRVDIDWGFQEGRQYGRGRSGGQVRDEYRIDYDMGRGGYGKVVQQELAFQGLQGLQQVAHQMVSPYAQPPPGKRQRYQASEAQQEQQNPRYRDRERRGSDDERDVD